MAEATVPYTGLEKREIATITRVDTIRQTAQSIARLRSEFITADHPVILTDEEIETPALVSTHLGENAPNALRTTLELYRGYHRVAREWEARSAKDSEKTTKELRHQLDLGDLGISEIRYGSDFIAVIMPPDAVNIYYQETQKRLGITEKNTKVGMLGFAGNLAVTSKSGEPCPVFIISDLQELYPQKYERIFAHERAHVVELNYLSRRGFVDVHKRNTMQRNAASKQVSLMAGDIGDSPEGQQVFGKNIVRLVQNFLADTRAYFIDEVVVEAASGNFKNPERLIEYLVDDINPSPFPGEEKHYGLGIREYMDGVLEGLAIQRDQGEIPPDIYIQIAATIEASALKFAQQNRLLGQKYIALWNSTSGSTEQRTNQFVSRMYAIPPGQQWKVEYFLHNDQRKALQAGAALRGELRFPDAHISSASIQSLDHKEKQQVFEWMLAEHLRQLPDGKDLLKGKDETSEMLNTYAIEAIVQNQIDGAIEVVEEEQGIYNELFKDKVPKLFIQLMQFAKLRLGVFYSTEEIDTKVNQFFHSYISSEFRFEQLMERQIREYQTYHSLSTEKREEVEVIWEALYKRLPYEEIAEGAAATTLREDSLGKRLQDLFVSTMDSLRVN